MAEPRAIRRKRLSRPLRLAIESGQLTKSRSYHDVGEGHGLDVSHLKRRGYRATGHDPHYSPDKRPRAADVVGLVYVLNTIADPAERSKLLRSSYRLARKALVVASRTDKAAGKKHRDGVLTSAGSFQRNWSSPQFRRYVSRILGKQVDELAPGVVVVTKPKRRARR